VCVNVYGDGDEYADVNVDEEEEEALSGGRGGAGVGDNRRIAAIFSLRVGV